MGFPRGFRFITWDIRGLSGHHKGVSEDYRGYQGHFSEYLVVSEKF